MRRYLTLLALVVLIVGGLNVAGPASANGPSGRPDPSITLRTTTQHLERGGHAVLAGRAAGSAPGTRVVVWRTNRATTPPTWRRAGRATVARNGSFRLPIRTRQLVSHQYFRACVGTGPGQRCSRTIRRFFDFPDGDVRVTQWPEETVASSPFEQSANASYSPITIRGTSSPLVREQLASALVLEQRLDGAWVTTPPPAEVTVKRTGRWTLQGRIWPVGQRTRLRVVVEAGASSGLRSSTTRPFTTRSWKNFPLDQFAVVSGSLLTWERPSAGVDHAWAPATGSTTFNVGRHCRTLYTRLGSKRYTTTATASAQADGTPLFSWPVDDVPSFLTYAAPARASDIRDKELVTISGSQAPDEGDRVFFDQYVTCTF